MTMIKAVAGIVLMCSAGPVVAQDVDAGRADFNLYCATCHGDEGRGDGPVRRILKITPADLTVLKRDNDGVFPMYRVVRQIDGRDPLLAHGGGMPLYGRMFPFEEASIPSETGQPIMTSRRIADVTAWLQTIQE